MSGDLVTLARKFVDLSDQLEATRAEIAMAVLQAGWAHRRPLSTSPPWALGGKKPQPQPQSQESPSKPNHLEIAKLAEAKIFGF